MALCRVLTYALRVTADTVHAYMTDLARTKMQARGRQLIQLAEGRFGMTSRGGC